MLDVTKAIEESADTFFYQVAYMMGIDRINSMLSQFGYGKPTGIDLDEEYNGLLPSREWKQKVHKKAWYQGILSQLASARATGLPLLSRWSKPWSH
jgi:penicillin-binding protein 2